MPVLESVVAGLLGRAIAAAGIKLYRGAERGPRSRRDRDLAAARTLDQYEVTDRVEIGAVIARHSANVAEQEIVDALEDADVQAFVHELLALRMVGDTGGRGERLHTAFAELLVQSLPTRRESDVRAVADDLWRVLDAECSAVHTTLDEQHASTLERVQGSAQFALLRTVLDGIDRHLQALSADLTTERFTYTEFARLYRAQVRTAHGTITPPDFERRRRVPIDALYVEPDIRRYPDVGDGRPMSLRELEREIGRTVLLGDPGGGKSTASGVIVERWARSERWPVPFLVVLRDFPIEGDDGPSVLAYLAQRISRYYQIEVSAGLVERFLVNGNALVVFDGLDELLDTTRRREMTEIVELFASRYPLTSILVTSRKVGYQQAPMDTDQFASYEIAGFDEARVEDYVAKWFDLEDERDEEPEALAATFLRESRGVPDLRRNPLMLALLCIIYRGERFIPRNRPDVYERCATMLFERWDSSRHIHTSLQAGRVIGPVLSFLAHWMLTRESEQDAVAESELIDETARCLLGTTFEVEHAARDAAVEFVGFCRGRAWVFCDVGSTSDGEALYKFAHRTFMEYFAALELTRTTATPEQLAQRLLPRIAQGEWDVVAQLAVQIENRHQRDGADRVLAAMLDDRRRRTPVHRGNVLAFLCRCLAFHRPAPALVRRSVRIVVDFTMSLDDRHGELSDFTTHPLWALLLNAGDSIEIVGDEIRTALGGLVDSDDEAARVRAWTTVSLADVGSIEEEYHDRRFWGEWKDAFHAAHADSFERVVRTDDYLLQYGVQRRYLDADRLFDRPERGFVLAFGRLSSDRPIAVGFVAVADALLSSVGRESPHGDAARQVRTIAECLDGLGDPPWGPELFAGPFGVSFWTTRDDEWTEPVDDPQTWFGCFVCAAVLVEIANHGTVDELFGTDYTSRGILGTIMRTRRGDEGVERFDEQAPFLAQPPERRALILGWASRTFDLVRGHAVR